MIDPSVFIGLPQTFQNKFNIYPPTVRDVISATKFAQYCRIITITEEDIRDEMAKQGDTTTSTTPFEFLLINAYYSEHFKQLAVEAFEFFLHQKVNFFFEEKMLVVGDLKRVVGEINSLDQLITIKEEDYFDFQNAIRSSIGEKLVKHSEPPNPNEDPRITAMKAKARERDRIKARHNSKNGISLSTSLIAICCMGLGITPLNIGEMSYASIGSIMSMMQDKEKYDIDIRSLLAGADSKKIKPKYWIRNSEKE